MGKKMTGKQMAAIALLVVGLVSAVFGVFGLAGGGDIEPYEDVTRGSRHPVQRHGVGDSPVDKRACACLDRPEERRDGY